MKIAVVIVALIFCGFLWFMYQDEDLTNYPPKNERIVAFGDSLVAGQGAPSGRGFVEQLSDSINRDITNLGVGGDTTAQGIARMEAVTALNPGMVILLLGGNDTLRRVPIAETEANLRTLIEYFQRNGALVVLLGVRGGLLRDSKADLYAELASEYKTAYVPDVLSGILLEPSLMADSIHPNEEGYSMIADRVLKVMQKEKLLE